MLTSRLPYDILIHHFLIFIIIICSCQARVLHSHSSIYEAIEELVGLFTLRQEERIMKGWSVKYLCTFNFEFSML